MGGAEDPGHPTVAQHRHVVDAVRSRSHSRHQRVNLGPGVRALAGRNAHPGFRELGQTGPPGQCHQRDQTRRRHEIRFVEDR